VEEVFVTRERGVLELGVNWPGGGETLRVTEEHPLWVEGEGWVEAGKLRSGDHIALADAGGWATVQSLRGPPGKETVYNFVVATTHTYFVGSGGTWVHNGGPCSRPEFVETIGDPVYSSMSPGSLSGRQLKSEYSSSKIDRYRSKMKNGKFDWIRSPIDVAIVENRVIILDGHHRARAAGAALAQGVKSLEKIPVRIWTVSEETATRLAEQASEAMISFGK
jgi:hypothetical protein